MVEDCRVIGLNRMRKCSSILTQEMWSGSWVWSDAATGEKLSSIIIAIDYEGYFILKEKGYFFREYTSYFGASKNSPSGKMGVLFGHG